MYISNNITLANNLGATNVVIYGPMFIRPWFEKIMIRSKKFSSWVKRRVKKVN